MPSSSETEPSPPADLIPGGRPASRPAWLHPVSKHPPRAATTSRPVPPTSPRTTGVGTRGEGPRRARDRGAAASDSGRAIRGGATGVGAGGPAGPGPVNISPHTLHSIGWPAFRSLTVYVVVQAGQE